jgi:WD40 repeat protein
MFDNMVTVWDAKSGASVQAFRTQNCRNTVFASKGHLLITGGNTDSRSDLRSKINCWDVTTGLLNLRVDAEKVYCLAISPNNRFLVAGNMDSQAQVFDLRRSRKVPYQPEQFEQ